MPQKNALQCPLCQKNFNKSQHSVGCYKCGTFEHKECAGVTDEKFDSIRKKIDKHLCKSCRNDSNIDIIKRIEEIKLSIEKNFGDTRNDLERRMDNGFHNLEMKMYQLIDNVRKEVNVEISKVKSANCYSMVKESDKANDMKYYKLQYKNNMLERRLNRSDILVSGLSCSLENIREEMIKIAKYVGVDISNSDIFHCCYIKAKKYFIIKFNSVQLRDSIMKNYFRMQPLQLNKVIGGSIESRIYLNDNLAPASSKLHYLCRKLLSGKKIRKFRVINMDNPKASIVMLDGKNVTLDIQQCANSLDGCLNSDGVQ